MNDNDIQLIAALVDGELPAAEQGAVLARMESDAELRAAYDEQLAVASTLRSLPEVSMTAAEQTALRTTLRTQLNLDGAVVAAAAAAPWWSRWWAPVTGLATAAVIVFAFVIVPNLDEDSADVVSAPAEATTQATSSLADVPAAESGSDPQDFLIAPGAEDGAATQTTAAAEAFYEVTAAGEGAELELPLLEEEAVEDEGVALARSQATTFTAVDLDEISACFSTALDSWPPLSTSLVGVTGDGQSIIGSAIDPGTGTETLFYINRATCAVTAAE